MSQATHAPSVRAPAEIKALNVVPSRRLELRAVRRIGLGVLAIQLILLLVWSGFEAGRHVQGSDFVGFYQAWYLISHGVLNPAGWWDAQAIFIQWPLAILGLIYPHPITLLVVQDFAIVGAELVAFLWICDLVAAWETIPLRAYALTGLALLVLNPWIYWSASWDYHSEPVGTLFAVLAARDLFRGRRIAALWCVLTALSGMIPVTYLTGIGLALMIQRRRRIVGAVVAASSAVWFLGLNKLGAGKTIGYQTVHSSAAQHGTVGAADLGLTQRFSTLAHMILHHWTDLFANLAPTGFIGVFTTPVVGVATAVLGENFSQGNPNSLVPSFQGLPLYIFVPIGTVVALMWLNRRFGSRLAHGVAALTVINVVGWGVVWTPKVVPTWLRTSTAQATSIEQVAAMIPQRDSVIASQGVVGSFANHPFVRTFFTTPALLPGRSPFTWFVIAPYAGIETATVTQSAEVILALARNPRAKLEYSRNNIWAFRVRVPRRDSMKLALNVDKTTYRLPAALFSTFGTSFRRGPVNSWYVAGSNNAPGPILWGDYYLEPVGRYRASVKIQGSGPATIEVLNDSAGKVLGIKRVVVSGSTTVTMPAVISGQDPKLSAEAAHGLGPFSIDPVLAYPGNNLEIQVFSTSKAVLKVRWVEIRPIAGNSAG